MYLLPQLTAAMEQSGSETWASINLGKFTVADVMGVICRSGLPVMVKGSKPECVGGV